MTGLVGRGRSDEWPGIRPDTALQWARSSAGTRRNRIVRIGLRFRFFRPLDPLTRKPYFPLITIDAQDLHFDLVVQLDDFFGVVHLVVSQFRDVQEALQTVFQADENPEVRDLGHAPRDQLSGL